MTSNESEALPIIGWREWVGLPELGIETIKAKVDTGARTSSIHAFDVEELEGTPARVRFKVWPEQRSSEHVVSVEAELADQRPVRPSTGVADHRYVIVTPVEILGRQFDIELTLSSRDEMGFRMLLGRQAVRGAFLVDPGRSFLNGRRARGTRRLARRRRTT